MIVAATVSPPVRSQHAHLPAQRSCRPAPPRHASFHESEPKALVRLQSQHWDPLLDWVSSRFGVRPTVAHDTLVASQPAELIDALRAHLLSLSPLQLAALERALHLTKSIYLSLALVDAQASQAKDGEAAPPGLDVEGAMHAAWVETRAQIETWGEVEDSHDVGWAELGRELGAVKMAVAATAA